MTQVFLSHSTKNAEIALRLAEDLRAAGIPVWKAPESILDNEEWVDAIQRGLTTSSHFLVVQSPASVESEWVKFEFNVALKRKMQRKMMISVIDYEPCSPPEFWEQFQLGERITDDYGTTLLRVIGWINAERPAKPPKPTTQSTTINVTVQGDVSGSVNVAGEDLYIGQPVEPEPELVKDNFEDYASSPQASQTVSTSRINGVIMLVLTFVIIAIIVAASGGFGGGAGAGDDATDEPTPTPIPTAGEVARQLAEEGLPEGSLNSDWTPYTEMINGAEMALVPEGCFMMGSEDGEDDESPVHRVCFEEPFWIDVYEVSNLQYGEAGEDCLEWSSEDSQPRVCITWQESLTHCETRDARLPTEAEWEYTAHGIESLIYPFGDDFEADKVIYSENSGNITGAVDSLPDGQSWVGAYHLSGNVWEWVGDWYDEEYYDVSPELNPQGPSTRMVIRVLRGGSWLSSWLNLRVANRYWSSDRDSAVGFRCARSYE